MADRVVGSLIELAAVRPVRAFLLAFTVGALIGVLIL